MTMTGNPSKKDEARIAREREEKQKELRRVSDRMEEIAAEERELMAQRDVLIGELTDFPYNCTYRALEPFTNVTYQAIGLVSRARKGLLDDPDA